MARKTFISYKYSESQELRDKIIEALDDDATYYQGETADSPDLTDTSAENIKKNLKDMMYGTSVTIVIISPNMAKSKWIDWEIEYCLKAISRDGRTSKTNGIVGVIQKHNNSYDWLVTRHKKSDGCTSRSLNQNKLYNVISKNRFNKKNPMYHCKECETFCADNDSYISIINEDEFLKRPSHYIEMAYEKSRILDDFNITKKS